MRKYLILPLLSVIFIMISFFSAGSAYSAEAYTFDKSSGLQKMADKVGLNNDMQPESYVGTVLVLLFSFLGIIFFILTIYAGLQWMTAQGDAAQVTKAKETLIRATVGLIIVIAAYGITFFIMNIFYKTSAPLALY